MVELRHLEKNASSTFLKKGKGGGQKLHTLGMISPQSCTEEFFDRACGLKKLGIRGRIATLVDAGGLVKLKNLDRLKLVYDPFPLLPFDGRFSSLPKSYEFPPKLRNLTLFSTCLDWTHMSILGMLDTLEVLKLKHRAFVGMRWEAADGVFVISKFFALNGQIWLIGWLLAIIFRGLDALHLGIVRSLSNPIGLADNLQKLDLDRVSKSALYSARKIEEAKKFKKGAETSKRSGFRLCIGPADRA